MPLHGAGKFGGLTYGGIDCFKRSKASTLHNVDCAHAQHQLIFDNEHRRLWWDLRESHGERTLSCGAGEIARATCALMASNAQTKSACIL